ncbi:MAG: DUF2156 domain-containing protein [Rhabdochlamydiaceae bacterium]|nr:DUF2156 domain-containing protein [Rhabdochlamydiaceae bacterium]
MQASLATNLQRDRLEFVELVRRFAGATSDAILDPSMQIFTFPGIEGFVSYRLEAQVVIVFGEPTCAEKDKPLLTRAFHKAMQSQSKNVIYITASLAFSQWAIENVCSTMIEMGEELFFDPFRNPEKETGPQGSLVRRKVKRALRELVTVSEYQGDDLQIEKEIELVGSIWLKQRRGTQFHISNVYLFQDRLGKRWFYAKKDDRIVGVVTINQLHSQEGWLLNHLMTTPDAPVGTSELLIVSVFDFLRKEGCHLVTVGSAPAKTLGTITGLSKPSSWMVRSLFQFGRKLGRLDGLNMFWSKFQPQRKPTFILFGRRLIGVRELIALKRCLSGRSKGEQNG